VANCAAEILAVLTARKAAFVGAHPSIERAEGLSDDNVVLVTVEDGRNGRHLRFGNGGDFFDYHALSFTLGSSAAGGQSNHPQRHDALRVDAKLGSFKRYLEPRVEQGTPFAGEGRRRTSRRTLGQGTIWATPFYLLADFAAAARSRRRRYPASLKRSILGSKRERKISASSGSSKQ